MDRSLRITFVMPRTGEWVAGGFRTVYQYANHLTRRGHTVTVVHPGRLVINPTPLDHVKNTVRYLLRKFDGRFTPDSWMQIEPGVRLTCVPDLTARNIPDGDIVFATAWQTAEYVAQYPASKGCGFYFVQHLETWNGPEDRVYATWKLPLVKVVPSRWLEEIAQNLGEPAIYIPYGLDVDTFHRTMPMAERDPKQLMMLFHDSEWKGCDDGLAALKLVHAKDPAIRVIFFGVPAPTADLPDWIEYHQSPSPDALRALYNRAAIFVAPSRTEGWGLTGCEALLCGAALAATDIDGHREFAFDGQTALTSPARDPEALAGNVQRLLNEPDLRMRLAQQGHDFVRQLTWERATDSLEASMQAHLTQQEPAVAHV